MLTFMPAPVADTTLDILGTPTVREQTVSPDVETVLGRPATPFETWAQPTKRRGLPLTRQPSTG